MQQAHLCRQIQNTNPDVKITITDPKGGFSRPDSFTNIDLSGISFDLTAAHKIRQPIF